jgi:hypothetical protein
MSQNPYPWVLTPFTTAATPPVTTEACVTGGVTATVDDPFAISEYLSASVPDCATAAVAATFGT